MTPTTRLASFFVPTLLLALSARAASDDLRAEVCSGRTVKDCRTVIEASLAAATASKADGAVVATKNTGDSSGDTPSAGSIRDLLSRLALLAGAPTSSGEDGSFTVELGDLAGKTSAVRGHVTLHAADVSKSILDAAPMGSRADLEKRLSGDLVDLSDVTTSFTYSPMTRRLGRSYRPHHYLYEAVCNELVKRSSAMAGASGTPVSNPVETPIQDGLELNPKYARIDFEGDDHEADTLPFLFSKTTEVPDPVQRELFAELVTSARGASASEGQMRKLVEASNLHRLADLIANQPQLTFNVSHRFRDDVVGADETSLDVSYEVGLGNANGLARKLANRAQRDIGNLHAGDVQEGFEQSLATFLDEHGQAARRGGRLKFGAEYKRIDDHRFELAPLSVDYFARGASTWTAKLGGGVYLAPDAEGGNKGRLDFDVSREQATGGKRASRVRGDVTYSYLLGKDTILSLGLTYANHPEDLGDVDHGISARVGLRYRWISKKEFDSPKWKE